MVGVPDEQWGEAVAAVIVTHEGRSVDADALRLERINELLAQTPEDRRDGLRPVDLLLMRPSQDLGALANDYEPRLPRGFRFLTRGLGTHQIRSNDFLSLVMSSPTTCKN